MGEWGELSDSPVTGLAQEAAELDRSSLCPCLVGSPFLGVKVSQLWAKPQRVSLLRSWAGWDGRAWDGANPGGPFRGRMKQNTPRGRCLRQSPSPLVRVGTQEGFLSGTARARGRLPARRPAPGRARGAAGARARAPVRLAGAGRKNSAATPRTVAGRPRAAQKSRAAPPRRSESRRGQVCAGLEKLSGPGFARGRRGQRGRCASAGMEGGG